MRTVHASRVRAIAISVTFLAAPVVASAAGEAPVTRVPADGAPIAITSWLVAGPFPSPVLPDYLPGMPERAGYDADHLAAIGGERAARPRVGTEIAVPGGTIRFAAHDWLRGYADLNDVFHVPTDVCAYLYAELESPVAQTCYLHFGSNAAGQAWVGDRLVIAHPDDRVAARSQNVARISLPRGRTRLLMKIDHDGGGWGAFAEVYGRTAHRAFVKAKFPRHLTLAADEYLPNAGSTVSVRIANWIPPDEPIPVRWTAIDGATEIPIAADGPNARFAIPPGPARAIRIRAVADHPRKGIVAGERAVLAGGVAAGESALAEYAAIDTAELTGHRRDAYALARYAVERAGRDLGTEDLAPGVAKIGAQVARLRVALDHVAAGSDMYVGRTGLFEGAYLSGADGTAQPFTLVVPYGYPARESYALFVNLHGASFTHELTGDWSPSPADSAHEEGTIILSVMGRGRWAGYVGLAEDDVFAAIRWASEHYRIDPDRVYLRGGSMGGMGTWRLASLYPDRFAGAWVDCGGPALETVPNLVNLPVFVNHGDADRSVPVAGARLGVAAMRAADCPVAYSEFPGVDHGVGVAVGPGGYMTRLAALRRNAMPDHVRVVATHPRYGRSYWADIERWIDPHATATLDARVLPGNAIAVTTANVARACVRPPANLLRASDVAWFVNGTRISAVRASDDAYDLVLADGIPSVRSHADEPAPAVRPYAPGSSTNLWSGEPLLIVYGSTSPNGALRDSIRALATEVSRWSAPETRMEFGSIPVKADTAVTDEDMAARNLVLLGGPAENEVTARLMPRMPVREEAGTLRIGEENPIWLAGRGYGFVHPNPERPRRLVLVYGSREPLFYTRCRGRLLRESIIDLGAAAPDVVVERIDVVPRLVRQRWFTHDWQLVETPRESIGRVPANARAEAEMRAEAYRRIAGAPFAIVDRAEETAPCSWDTAACWADRPVALGEIAAFEATGRELLALADGDWWMLCPQPDATGIDTAATYRVAGPYWTVLGAPNSRRTNARNVRLMTDAALIDAVARDVWVVGRR